MKLSKVTKKFSFKLFWVLICISLFPLFLSSLFSYFFLRVHLEKLAFSKLEKINALSSLEIENLIADAFNDIYVLYYNPILTSKETSIEEKSKELGRIHKYYQLFQDITILDGKGRLITSSGYKFYGKWEANFWFLQAKEKKEIVLSDIYAAISPEEPILAIFAPVLNQENEIDFFIVAQVDLRRLWNIIDFKIGQKGVIFLVNSRGDIIAHSDKKLLFEKVTPNYPLEKNSLLKRGITKFNFNKENYISSFRVIEKYGEHPGHNWHLIVAQPENEIFLPLESLRTQILIFSFLVFSLILFFALFLGIAISRPLKTLTLAAEKVKMGNLEAEVKIKSEDEFGKLASVFNEMIKEIKRSQLSLEEEKTILKIKVKARTKQLEELVESLEDQVKARTQELQKKIEELEKFHQIAIGRELKMIELKKEIEKLKKELEKYKE